MTTPSGIKVHPVHNAKTRRTFLTFPWRIYQDDPLWVPPLLREQAKTIDPRHGAFFKRGEASFFIAWRGRCPVGTICAAEDHLYNAERDKKTCIFGFFECIEDYAVAEALFERVRRWAKNRALNMLFGPFNLDYENSYGILIEGRDRPPTLLCGHTPAYYQDFVERFGFKPGRADNIAYAVDLQADTPALQHLTELAKKLRQRGGITVRHADLSQWDTEVDRVHRLLNTVFVWGSDHMPWERSAVAALLAPFREIADPELVLFAEVNGETVGFFPGIANLNEALIHANGLRYPWDMLKLWWHTRRQPACLAIKSVLVDPEYWNTGVSALLFDEMLNRAREKGYAWADLSLTSTDNPQTPKLAERLGAKLYKRYRVYKLPLEG